jgi:hypothetical protein
MSNKLLKGLFIGMLVYLIYLIFEQPIVAFVQSFIIQHNLQFLVAFLRFELFYIAMIGIVFYIAEKIS